MTIDARPSRRLEALAAFCLGAPADDYRLGDLSELHVRTEAAIRDRLEGVPGGALVARVTADARYLAATVNVMVFAALDVREKIMILLQSAVHRFALPAVLLACSALMLNDAVHVWNGWQQTEALMTSAQREKAETAARGISSFKSELARQIGWIDYPFSHWSVEQRRRDYARLLMQAPAVMQIGLLDWQGREQLVVNRYMLDVIGSEVDRSADAAFIAARKDGHYVGPVHADKHGAPAVTAAFVHSGTPAGVTVVEVGLKPVLDIVAAVKTEHGSAYVLDDEGRRLSPAAESFTGPVRSVSADVPGTRWKVVVDVPSAAYAVPERNAAIRAVSTAGLALVAAALAFMLVLRPAVPARQAAA
jgi:hypothetical protein